MTGVRVGVGVGIVVTVGIGLCSGDGVDDGTGVRGRVDVGVIVGNIYARNASLFMGSGVALGRNAETSVVER